jgi:hypothetical protein
MERAGKYGKGDLECTMERAGNGPAKAMKKDQRGRRVAGRKGDKETA